MSAERIRVVVVDDEPLARRGVIRELARHPEIEVVAECGDGCAAVEVIEREHPDLVLLDVEMPGIDGLEVVDAVGPESMPVTVFVTAYDHYALDAFRAHAVDYVLKPLDPVRFDEAIRRAQDLLTRSGLADLRRRVEALGEEVARRRDTIRRFVVRERGRILFVPLDDVDRLSAADNYVRLHAGPHHHLVRGTLVALLGRLPGGDFVRVHRSHAVRVDRIVEIEPTGRGDFRVVLRNGDEVVGSRRYREELDRLLDEGVV